MREELEQEAHLDEVILAKEALFTAIHSGYTVLLRPSFRRSREGAPTLCVSEVFDITWGPALAPVIQEQTGEGKAFQWVTRREIENGQTEDGVIVGANAKSLLDPRQPASVPDFL